MGNSLSVDHPNVLQGGVVKKVSETQRQHDAWKRGPTNRKKEIMMKSSKQSTARLLAYLLLSLGALGWSVRSFHSIDLVSEPFGSMMVLSRTLPIGRARHGRRTDCATDRLDRPGDSRAGARQLRIDRTGETKRRASNLRPACG